MRGWLWIATLATGCYRSASEAPCTVACTSGACPNGLVCIDQVCRAPGGGCGLDAAARDAGPFCYGQGLFRPCFDALPTGAVFYQSPARIDTDFDPSCAVMTQNGGVNVCVIAADTISISSYVTTQGSRPLVLVAVSMLTVDVGGTIDVASYAQQNIAPAGAVSGPCNTLTPPAYDATGNGAGGGAGGSWLATGGNGGASPVNSGGLPAVVFAKPTTIRGGCPAASGGSSAAYLGGFGGAAGGAVDLIAGELLVVSGTIDASGGGGGAPGLASGGGGGGTGGFIGLDAPMFSIASNARIFAIGGGGASGGAATSAGNYGPDATGPGPTGAAIAPANGGAGGIGTANAGLVGGNATASPGGGGGGGGAGGFIGAATFSAFPSPQPATIQPPAVAM